MNIKNRLLCSVLAVTALVFVPMPEIFYGNKAYSEEFHVNNYNEFLEALSKEPTDGEVKHIYLENDITATENITNINGDMIISGAKRDALGNILKDEDGNTLMHTFDGGGVWEHSSNSINLKENQTVKITDVKFENSINSTIISNLNGGTLSEFSGVVSNTSSIILDNYRSTIGDIDVIFTNNTQQLLNNQVTFDKDQKSTVNSINGTFTNNSGQIIGNGGIINSISGVFQNNTMGDGTAGIIMGGFGGTIK
ncbi:hypothetical protein II906_04065, partial [bacterium]|nr:hypothetical protein [bacterium]